MAPLSESLQPGAPIAAPDDPGAAAAELRAVSGAAVYPDSVTVSGAAAFFIARRGAEKRAGVAWNAATPEPPAAAELGGRAAVGGELRLRTAPAGAAAGAVLQKHLACLQPKLIGLATSLGLGDRLGVATPGHARAVKGTGLAAFFCQQSIREMTRTGRSPQEVQATAALGALEAGWRGGYGADADHLKTAADLERCLAAGFTMFTLDPGDHVDPAADRLAGPELAAGFAALPWGSLGVRS